MTLTRQYFVPANSLCPSISCSADKSDAGQHGRWNCRFARIDDYNMQQQQADSWVATETSLITRSVTISHPHHHHHHPHRLPPPPPPPHLASPRLACPSAGVLRLVLSGINRLVHDDTTTNVCADEMNPHSNSVDISHEDLSYIAHTQRTLSGGGGGGGGGGASNHHPSAVPSSRRPSTGASSHSTTSSTGSTGISLDPRALAQLSAHFDALLGAITTRVENVFPPPPAVSPFWSNG